MEVVEFIISYFKSYATKLPMTNFFDIHSH
jgi:hypothetical protein